MFNNLRRYYNQNRNRIWRVIIIIAFAFAILQLANTIAKNNNERKIREATSQTRTQTTTASSKSNTVSSGESSSYISSSSSQTSETKAKISTIDQFVTYCNGQDLNSAYNMLTDSCKQEMFSNIDIFKNIYYDSTFENMQKEATIENWTNNTYLVKFTENALVTGKIATTKEEQKIDYITVVKDEENNYKLNINSYVGYTELSKSNKKDNVTIEVIGKHTYIEYETYVVKIINNSDEDVILDSLYNAEKLYIEDTKGVKYPAYTSELEGILNISAGHTRQINIKFFSSYSSSKKIRQLVFSDYMKGNVNSNFNISL